MRNKPHFGRMAGLATAAAAIFVLAFPSVSPAGGPTTSLDLAALKSVLVSQADVPEGTFLTDPITLRDIAAAGGLNPLAGMTSSPTSCLTFVGDALGDIGLLDGWIQFGARPAPLGLHAFSIQLVANIPGGADLRPIRAAALTCQRGTVTLEDRITGSAAFRTQVPPHLKSALALVTRMTTTFEEPTTTSDAELLAKYNFHPGACPADYVFVTMGDVLIWSLDPDPTLAVRAATIMHDRTLIARD